MKRKTKRKIKNAFLKGFTAFMGGVWVMSILCADSPSNIPMLTLWLSTIWLTYFMWANGAFGEKNDADI